MPLRRKVWLKRKNWSKRKGKPPLKRKWVKDLDIAWSLFIRNRDKKCVKCGSVKNLQASHIISRRKRSTRWLPENGKTLCYGCHIFWWHKEPVEAAAWIKSYLGAAALRKLQNKAVKIDAPLTLERYISTLRTLQSSLENHKEV